MKQIQVMAVTAMGMLNIPRWNGPGLKESLVHTSLNRMGRP